MYGHARGPERAKPDRIPFNTSRPRKPFRLSEAEHNDKAIQPSQYKNRQRRIQNRGPKPSELTKTSPRTKLEFFPAQQTTTADCRTQAVSLEKILTRIPTLTHPPQACSAYSPYSAYPAGLCPSPLRARCICISGIGQESLPAPIRRQRKYSRT